MPNSDSSIGRAMEILKDWHHYLRALVPPNNSFSTGVAINSDTAVPIFTFENEAAKQIFGERLRDLPADTPFGEIMHRGPWRTAVTKPSTTLHSAAGD